LHIIAKDDIQAPINRNSSRECPKRSRADREKWAKQFHHVISLKENKSTYVSPWNRNQNEERAGKWQKAIRKKEQLKSFGFLLRTLAQKRKLSKCRNK